jgi:uncharacterized membrane protein YqjE
MYQEDKVRYLRERSMGELLGDLSSQTTELIRDEIQLAKVELTEKAREAGVGAAILAGAALVALLAMGALTAFLILVLGEAMPHWAAALVIFALYAAAATSLAFWGRNRLRQAGSPVPETTVQTLKEDVRWAKRQLD